MKKIITIIFLYSVSLTPAFAATAPNVPKANCKGLPGCENSVTGASEGPIEIITSLVGYLIQYVAVAAVIALMISGIMYLVSGGEEEKVKKAKTWIIWSLVGVVLSISAWTIVNLINNIFIL